MITYLMEYEAQTRSEAEQKSLEILGLGPDDVEFETVSSGGLKRLFKSSPVLVRAIPRKKSIPQENIARGVIYTLIYKLGIDAQIANIEDQEGSLYITLTSKKSALLIGKHGRTLDALQFLLNLLVSKWVRDDKRIVLDVSDYRQRRRKSLEGLCARLSDKVAQSRRGVTLSYMSPYERRIVHILLDDDERVYTESVGNGVYKRVRIFPQQGPGESSGKYLPEDEYDDSYPHSHSQEGYADQDYPHPPEEEYKEDGEEPSYQEKKDDDGNV